MKKRTGKMISLSLAVAMAVTAAPVTALADENTQSNVIEASELTPAQSAGETGTDTTTVDTKEEEGTAWAELTPANKASNSALEETNSAEATETLDENSDSTTREVFNQDALETAIADAKNGEITTIKLGCNINLTNQNKSIPENNAVITLPAGVTLDGGGNSIIASEDWDDSVKNHLVGILDSSAEIRNVTITGNDKTRHGINAYGENGNATLTLTDVAITNCGTAGIVVNGANVVANNITTSGNKWGAINVGDQAGSKLTLTNGSFAETQKIWSEYSSDEASTNITVNGLDTVAGVMIKDGTEVPFTYYTDDASELATFLQAEAYNETSKTIYASFASAIKNATSGDKISLTKDVEVANSFNIPEGVTLDGDNQYTLSLTTSQNIFIDITKDNVTIQNITIDAQGNAKHAVQFWKSNSSKVLNCKIINDGKSAGKTYCTGIHVNSSNVTIENCEFNVTAKPALFGGGSAGVELGVSSDTSTESELPHINVKNLTGVPADNLVKVPMDTHFSIAQILGKTPFTEEYFDYLNENLLDGVVIDSDGTHCLFNIKFDANGGTLSGEGTMTTDANGKLTSALPTASLSGYRFDGWYTATSGGEKITADTVFTEDTTVYAQWSKKSSGGSHRYDGYITIINPKNGEVSVSDDWADEDEKITLTITPDKGYVVDKIEIVDAEGDKIDAKKVEDKDDKYTFRMANCDVTVTVTFKEEGKTTEDTDKEEDKDDETTETTKLNFTDVKETDWFFKGVEYVVDKGIMSGVSENEFAPSGKLTRAMLVQMLYNMESRPACDAENAFIDVPVGQWYTDAVIWANDAKIVSGMGEGLFAPNMEITREQMVAMLYNYAKYKGYDVTASADLSTFADNASVSAWAQPAMQWAVAEGYISGMGDNQLAPQGTATRAEIASVIMRFMEATAETAE